MASVPPYPPDFFSSDNVTTQCLILSGVCRTLAIVAVSLRFAARKAGGSRFWWDDWLMLVLAAVQIPSLAVDISAIQRGMGQHLGWVLATRSDITEYLKFQYVDGLSYAPEVALLKTSLLCLYIRLFGVQKNFRRICYAQIAVITLWAVVADLVYVFQCNPIGITWSVTRDATECFDVKKYWYSVSAINILTDIGLLVTPLPLLFALKLPWEKWIYIATILALGLTDFTLSIVRLIKVGPLPFIDTTWDSATVLLWSVLQGCILIIVVCLPIMAPLILWPVRWLARHSHSSKTDSLAASLARTMESKGSRLEPFSDEHELVPAEASLEPIRVTRTVEIKVTEEQLRPEEVLGLPWQGAWMFHGDGGIRAGHRS